MFSEARKQSMAWMETYYSKYFLWKIRWQLEHLDALGTMGETVPLMIAILFVQCASDSHAVVVLW